MRIVARRILAIAILLGTAAGPAFEAWAQSAFYRYSHGMSGSSVTPPGPGTGEPGGGSETPSVPFSVGNYESVPPATLGEAFNIPAPTISGGTAPYAAALSSGSLPPNVHLNGDGSVSGTPSALGSHTATVLFSDAKGHTQARGVSVTVASSPIIVHPGATLAIGQPHTSQFSFSGGSGNYSSVTINVPGLGSATIHPGDSAQPLGMTGLSLTSGLTIAGTPATSLKSIVGATVSAVDSAGRTSLSSAPFDLLVGIDAAQYQPGNGGGSGSAITITPIEEARGGTGTLTYSVISSPSTPGITVDAQTGIVSVAASVPADNYAVTVTASDGGSPAMPSKASVPFTVAMVATIPRPSSANLAGGSGKTASFTPAATGADAVDRLYDGDSSTLITYSVGSTQPTIMWISWAAAQPINCVILEATKQAAGTYDVLFVNGAGVPTPKMTTAIVGASPTTLVVYSGNPNPTGANALIRHVQIEAPLGSVGTIRTLRAGKMSNPDGTGSCVTAS